MWNKDIHHVITAILPYFTITWEGRGKEVKSPFTMFRPDWAWLALYHFGNLSLLGILVFYYFLVSGLEGPDQMNRPYLISNTHCKISLVVSINVLLSVSARAMINSFA